MNYKNTFAVLVPYKGMTINLRGLGIEMGLKLHTKVTGDSFGGKKNTETARPQTIVPGIDLNLFVRRVKERFVHKDGQTTHKIKI